MPIESLVTVTVAPGTTAPVTSTTVPVMDPDVACATRLPVHTRNTAASTPAARPDTLGEKLMEYSSAAWSKRRIRSTRLADRILLELCEKLQRPLTPSPQVN